MFDIDEIYEKIIEKYEIKNSSDLPSVNFKDRYNKLMNSLSEDEQKIIVSLLMNFNFYTKENKKKQIQKMCRIIEEKYYNTNDMFIGILPSQNHHMNSSHEIGIILKLIGNMSDDVFMDCDIEGIANKYHDGWNEVKTIVVVDDFSGSGNTFIDYVEKNLKYLTGKKIILLTLCIMEDAMQKICKKFEDENICINAIGIEVMKKAFIGKNNEKRLFKDLSKKRDIPKKYILGYNNTESLLGFHDNTPNNTLGIFWMDKGDNKPLFERKFNDKVNWKKMQKNKKMRKNSNFMIGKKNEK